MAGVDPNGRSLRSWMQAVKIRSTAIVIMIVGALSIIADVFNFFPAKSGAYAIAGAVLVAAGILVLADN